MGRSDGLEKQKTSFFSEYMDLKINQDSSFKKNLTQKGTNQELDKQE